MGNIAVRTMVALAAAQMLVLSAAAAGAETLTWSFRSGHENVVSLEFYSQERDHVWPGDNQVYLLEDYDAHDFTLSCISGENICYGAWVRNRSDIYWGVGMNNQESCDDCCYVCDGGSTEEINLDP